MRKADRSSPASGCTSSTTPWPMPPRPTVAGRFRWRWRRSCWARACSCLASLNPGPGPRLHKRADGGVASLRRRYSSRPMRRSTALLALLMALSAPAAAQAQVVKPKPVAAPKPAAGRISIKVQGGQRTKRLRYVVKGARIIVSGRSQPYVAGQVAVLGIVRHGRVVATRRAPIRQAGSAGQVTFSFKARRRGGVRLFFRHTGTAAQRAFRSRSARIKVISPQAGQGARGIHVLLLQRELRALGYA